MARRISNRSVGRVRSTDGRGGRPSAQAGIDHADAHLEDWRSVRRRAATIGCGRTRQDVDLAAKLMVRLLESSTVRSQIVQQAKAAIRAGQLDSAEILDQALDRMIDQVTG